MPKPPGSRRSFRFPWRSRTQISRDVEEELRFHLDMRTAELVGEGMDEDSARRRARREFGDVAQASRQLKALDGRREVRERRITVFSELQQDVRFALRNIRRSRGFAALAIVVLALAIGANSAIFSIINLLLFKPLAIDEPARVIGVFGKDASKPDAYRAFSYPNYIDLRDRVRQLDGLAAFNPTLVGIGNDDDTTRREMVQLVSRNYFSTLGVSLPRGRTFTVEESAPNAGILAAIISESLWMKLGAEPDLGRIPLRVNGSDFTVVGVSPARFTGTSTILSPAVWLPFGVYGSLVTDFLDASRIDLNDRDRHQFMLVGRLARGVRAREAERELQGIAAQLAADYPSVNRDQTIVLSPLSKLSMSTRPQENTIFVAASALLMGMAGVVLLIACLNLANMLLARGAARATEMAIRQSLGGGRPRILRQLLTEGAVLSLFGGIGGILLAYWSAKFIAASIVPILPFGGLNLDVSVDVRVLIATLAFCFLATMLFGLGPALKLVRANVVADLKDTAGQLARGKSRLVPRNTLVVAQIALSLVLLTAAGLFVRGALKAGSYDPVYELEGAVLADLDTTLVGYDEPRSREIYDRLVERLRALPAVETAAIASNVPLSPVDEGSSVRHPDHAGDDEAAVSAQKYIVGSQYFATMGLAVLRGREFTEAEATTDTGTAVAIINEPLARQLAPDGDLLGRHVLAKRARSDKELVPVEVVGIVPGVRHHLFDREPTPHIYLPFGQNYRAQMIIQARLRDRSPAAENAMLQALRGEIRAIDERLPILAMRSFSDHRDNSFELWLIKIGAQVFSALGAVALLMALLGVYGVKSYVVSRRTREIGLRMALGAEPRDVLRLMLREGLLTTLLGLGIGFVFSLGVAQLLAVMLWEISPTDPVTFVGAPILLAGSALLASYLPSLRATRVTPTTALRHE